MLSTRTVRTYVWPLTSWREMGYVELTSELSGLPFAEPRKVLFSQAEEPNARPPCVRMAREDSLPEEVK